MHWCFKSQIDPLHVVAFHHSILQLGVFRISATIFCLAPFFKCELVCVLARYGKDTSNITCDAFPHQTMRDAKLFVVHWIKRFSIVHNQYRQFWAFPHQSFIMLRNTMIESLVHLTVTKPNCSSAIWSVVKWLTRRRMISNPVLAALKIWLMVRCFSHWKVPSNVGNVINSDMIQSSGLE